VGHGPWAAYSASTAGLVAGGMVLAGASTSDEDVGHLRDRAGLIQRATIAIGWAWLALLSIRSLGAAD
jgi:hypothetical protein